MALNEYGSLPRRFPKAMSAFLDKTTRREARLIAPFLDTKFYLENNSDVAAAEIDPCYHYAKYGWREGRDPSPSFSTKGYLAAHPKVALSGTNPLLHFVQQSDVSDLGHSPEENEQLDAEVALVAENIDEKFYAATYPDNPKSGQSSAEHYCRVGWREGNDPTPGFSTSYYLLSNPDVRDSGVNPFWHYLIAGREEGRLPVHPGGWRHGVLSRQTSFDAYCEDWKKQDDPPDHLSAGELVKRLVDRRRAPGLMVSLGHDDYRATPGGVQLCVEIEAQNAEAYGADYLNLHPWQPLPKLADADEDYALSLVLNGSMIGVASVSNVTTALGRLNVAAQAAHIVIHHLAGHAPERVAEIADALNVERAHLWLHDYFTLCTSYALQRNNITPCNVPSQSSNACHICLFGGERRAQSVRIETLFEAIDIHVISPSKVALDLWSDRTALAPASTTVHPHVELSAKPVDAPDRCADGPIRIAFIGTPAAHKGWPIFEELARRLKATDEYEFWFFGSDDPVSDGILHYPTHVRASDPASTLAAVAENSIDLVLHWASWPETFSFSTYEALGGGAFVVTNAGSGNVAATVRQFDRGVVLEDANALYDFASTGNLKELAKRARDLRRSERLTVCFSGMTHDILTATHVEEVA